MWILNVIKANQKGDLGADDEENTHLSVSRRLKTTGVRIQPTERAAIKCSKRQRTTNYKATNEKTIETVRKYSSSGPPGTRKMKEKSTARLNGL